MHSGLLDYNFIANYNPSNDNYSYSQSNHCKPCHGNALSTFFETYKGALSIYIDADKKYEQVDNHQTELRVENRIIKPLNKVVDY